MNVFEGHYICGDMEFIMRTQAERETDAYVFLEQKGRKLFGRDQDGNSYFDHFLMDKISKGYIMPDGHFHKESSSGGNAIDYIHLTTEGIEKALDRDIINVFRSKDSLDSVALIGINPLLCSSNGIMLASEQARLVNSTPRMKNKDIAVIIAAAIENEAVKDPYNLEEFIRDVTLQLELSERITFAKSECLVAPNKSGIFADVDLSYDGNELSEIMIKLDDVPYTMLHDIAKMTNLLQEVNAARSERYKFFSTDELLSKAKSSVMLCIKVKDKSMHYRVRSVFRHDNIDYTITSNSIMTSEYPALKRFTDSLIKHYPEEKIKIEFMGKEVDVLRECQKMLQPKTKENIERE